MGVTRKVITCQVNQHDVLGILLRVIQQKIGAPLVLLHISGAERGTGYRVNAYYSVLHLAMGLRGRTEYAESSKIEIKQLRGWIDAPQSAIDLEIISGKGLFEASAQYNLEHISP